MDNLNINISVSDCYSSKCCTNNNSTTQTFTNLSNFISVQCGYTLKIIAVSDARIVLSVDNGVIFFVREAFIGIPNRIYIPNNCACHIVTIMVNGINVS